MPGPHQSLCLLASGRPDLRGQAEYRPMATLPCTSKASVGKTWVRVEPVLGYAAHAFAVPHRVAALGLAAGIVLVLLLLCLYRVLCPRNYGQPGGGPGRRRRGELPCDDYGYAPPETEIVPLVLRGHLMVSGAGLSGQQAVAAVALVNMAPSRRTSSVWPAMGCY